jgi:hypothetical protein
VRTILHAWRGRLTLAAVGLVAVGAGIAYGAIPDAAGVIHGCYRTSTDDQKGQLRVVEEPGNCRNNELPIEWSVTGPPGPPGAPGADGEDGEDGDPFSGTFTSPNGQYSLSVTDTGIRLAGAGSTILLDANGIELESSTALTLQSGLNMSLKADGGLTAEASAIATLRGAGVTVDSGTLLTLEGQVVRIGPGPGCSPTARLGDPITGTAAGASVTGFVSAGSPVVCVG